MKVILLKDVKGRGRANETITVADGYALNFLIPKQIAVLATPSAEDAAALRKKQDLERGAVDEALLAQNLAALADTPIHLRVKTNDKGHLYTAVHASDIAAAAKAEASLDLPEEVIRLEKPIKETGTFTVPLAHKETFGSLTLIVEAE